MFLVITSVLLSVNSVTWAEKPPLTQRNGAPKENGCYYPFEPVGSGCYYFSTEPRNYYGASKYCESLTQGHAQVTLAMLDFDKYEDEAIMAAATAKNDWFWLGAETEDTETWRWVDGRVVNLQAPYWYGTEPNEPSNMCLSTNMTSTGGQVSRSYLYDLQCGMSINFICQTGCPFDFRLLQNKCYFISEELGLSHLTWLDARDYCMNLDVPDGYHVDLAVLGLEGQDDYSLMNSLLWGFTNTSTAAWMGVTEDENCNYSWTDGRPLPVTSLYWYPDEPDCTAYDGAALYHYEAYNRTYLRDDWGESDELPFVCQMFPSI